MKSTIVFKTVLVVSLTANVFLYSLTHSAFDVGLELGSVQEATLVQYCLEKPAADNVDECVESLYGTEKEEQLFAARNVPEDITMPQFVDHWLMLKRWQLGLL